MTLVNQGGFANAAFSPTGRTVHLSGGAFANGQSLTTQFDGPAGTTFHVLGYSSCTSGGVQTICQYFQHARDPLSSMVVEGGSSGTSFLGYAIPAGSYGYFYQTWPGLLNGDPLSMDQLVVKNQSSVLPTNFQVLDYSVNTVALEADTAETDGLGNLLFGGSMLNDAMAGAGVAPVSWGYDMGLGAMVADFDLTLTGLASSKILAFTSSSAPFVNGVFGDVLDPMQSNDVLVPVNELGDSLQESFRWSGTTAQQQLFYYQRDLSAPSTLLLLGLCIGVVGAGRGRRHHRLHPG